MGQGRRLPKRSENAAVALDSGIYPRCTDCQDRFGYEYQSGRGFEHKRFNEDLSNGHVFDKGGFSWHPCDCCGSTLGGDRFAAHDSEGNHYEICVDCLMNAEGA